MKKIYKFKDAIQLLDIDTEGIDVIKDILLHTFMFEYYFPKSKINEIVILKNNEEYEFPQLIPEVDETIGNFNKRIYILCDTGEGLIVYHQKGGFYE